MEPIEGEPHAPALMGIDTIMLPARARDMVNFRDIDEMDNLTVVATLRHYAIFIYTHERLSALYQARVSRILTPKTYHRNHIDSPH